MVETLDLSILWRKAHTNLSGNGCARVASHLLHRAAISSTVALAGRFTPAFKAMTYRSCDRPVNCNTWGRSAQPDSLGWAQGLAHWHRALQEHLCCLPSLPLSCQVELSHPLWLTFVFPFLPWDGCCMPVSALSSTFAVNTQSTCLLWLTYPSRRLSLFFDSRPHSGSMCC